MQVRVRVRPMAEPSVTVVRHPGWVILIVSEGLDTLTAGQMARDLLTCEERDHVRAAFGIPPVEEVPELTEAWADMPPTITAEAIDPYMPEPAITPTPV